MRARGGALRASTATVVFTDLVGSTALRSRLGEEVADDLRRRHDDALKHVVEVHGGSVVKSLGDGLMATFSGAANALKAAVGMQQEARRLTERMEADLAIRVGISVGDVTWEGDDCFGEPVIEASRLCEAAEGGQILCSRLVDALARGRSGHEVVSVGDLDLKGLAEPVPACEVWWSPATAPAVPLPTVLRTRAPFAFVGRAEQRAVLDRAWKQAASGEPSTVLVVGEPGVGKTRLVSEFTRAVHDEGALVLAGRCDEEVSLPYQPFVEALAHFVDHTPAGELRNRLGRFSGDLARILPDLPERVEGLSAPLRSDEATERYRLFEAVVAWLAAVSVDQPTLLVIDDLHWAGRPTILLLRHLLRSPNERRLLVALTYRDTDVDRSHPLGGMLADLRRAPENERLVLRGLAEDEVRAFVESAAGHELDDRENELVAALHTETNGHPLFIEEVLRHLVETGAIYQDEAGRWRSDVDSIDEFGIPEGVREAIGRRLSRLSDGCNDVLGRAAVLGPEFSPAALATMADQDVVEPLDEAEAAGLVAAISEASPRYGFTHALVRHALLDDLSLARRQQYHRRAGEALGSTGGSPAAVAVHYRQAGAAVDAETAVQASMTAAEEARDRLAYEEASEHWEAALDLLEVHGGDLDQKARLLALLGDAMYALGTDWQRGIDQLERARRLYDDLGDDYNAAKLRSRIARNLSTFPGRLDIPRAFEHLEAAEAVLRGETHSAASGFVDVGFAGAAVFAAQNSRGFEAAARAYERGRELDNRILVANSLALAGWHQCHLGEIDAGTKALQDAYELAVETGDPVLTFITTYLGIGIDLGLDPARAARRSEAELSSGRLDNAPGLHAALQFWRRGALCWTGRLAEARAVMVEVPTNTGGYLWQRMLEGEWDVLVEAERVIAESVDAGNLFDAIGMTAYLGALAHLPAGRLEDAASALLGAHKLAARTDSDLLPMALVRPQLALVQARRGFVDEAQEHLAWCRAVLARGENWRGRLTDISIAEGVAASEVSEAEGHFRRAIEVARQYHLPFSEADAHQEWGLRTRRVEYLDRALAIYDRIDAAEAWKERGRRLRAGVTDE